jgi:hypothetical protein
MSPSVRVGFVGNCQAELLSKVFGAAADNAGVTTFYHYFDVPAHALERAHQEIAACDVLLLQDITDVENYPLHEQIPSRVKVIRIPFLRFAAPWPYDDFNGVRDSQARARDDSGLHTTTYYDGMLSRLRRSLPDPAERLAAYRKLDFAGAIDPLRVLDFESRRLEALDERFGISIGRFILGEFRDRQLFYTVNRPCGALLAQVMDHIVQSIGIDVKISSEQELDELRAVQVPVHPSVAARLGLKWASEATLYESPAGAVTWEDHVRRYVARYG